MQQQARAVLQQACSQRATQWPRGTFTATWAHMGSHAFHMTCAIQQATARAAVAARH
jgi:hypothetical protein